ncbi:MAG: efflux RND transporter periplasmic adaptor subunit [Gammaproteobacteria bacterium]|nr:efflux RND transporter periplasmic adaptor subunit [Gammaproteobacteria bacterium]
MVAARRYAGPLAVVIVGFGLSALIVGTGPELDTAAHREDIPVVRTLAARTQTVRMTVTTHGTVAPKTESQLVAEVAGRVVAVAPTLVSGGFFASGDTLVEIERIDYEFALEQSRAQLASARGDLAHAEKAYARQEELSATQSVSESQRDDALSRLVTARALLRQATAGVARAERDLERTRLTAPYDGRVRAERIDVGQFVARGESVATLYSIDFAEVRLPVRDQDIAFLPVSLARSGDDGREQPKVVLRAPVGGVERSWEARIVRTEGELDPRTRMTNLIAQVAAPYDQPGNQPALTVGLFVEAEIAGNVYEDIVAVPRSALREGNRVHLVDGSARLVFRRVDVLRVTGETAYLRGGIAPGETICLTILPDPIEGQRVRAAPVLGDRAHPAPGDGDFVP